QLLARERERLGAHQVGGRDYDAWRTRHHVVDARTVEQFLVEVLHLEIAAAHVVLEQPRPVRRRQYLVPQVLLGVLVEEALLVAVEGTAPVQRVVGGGERAAGYRRDDVDLVEQRALRAVRRGHLEVAQRLEHAIGERRGALAAAGEGQYHEQL